MMKIEEITKKVLETYKNCKNPCFNFNCTNNNQGYIKDGCTLFLWIEKAISMLSDKDKFLIEIFYLSDLKKKAIKASEKLFLENSSVYRHKDMALKNLTENLFGIKIFKGDYYEIKS